LAKAGLLRAHIAAGGAPWDATVAVEWDHDGGARSPRPVLTREKDLDAIAPVFVAATAFVGTHFLLSHPLRRPLVQAMGEAVFLGIYALVAIATLSWMASVYRATPTTAPLWEVGNVLWAIVTVIMLLASVLLMGSLAIRHCRHPGQRARCRPRPGGSMR